jgi:hypothetical protein
MTPASRSILFCGIAQRAAMTGLVRRMSQRLYELSEMLMSADVVVLGGLAGLFCWTYIFLPLVFFH